MHNATGAKERLSLIALTAAAFPLCIICQTVLEYKSENDRNAVP